MAGEKLVYAADKLSRVGSAWDEFILALESEVTIAKDNCVASPLENLQVNQGRAQSLTSLLGKLKTCRVEADRLRKAQPLQNPR